MRLLEERWVSGRGRWAAALSSSPKKLGGTAFATPPYKTNLVFLSARIMPYKKWSETAKQLRPYKPEGFTYRVGIGPNVPR